MKKLVILVLLTYFLPTFVNAQNVSFKELTDKATAEYTAKNYEEAVKGYQTVIDSGYHSAEIYYNIGNAYFKLGNVPQAILNYERALLQKPTDEDIKFNLEKSRTYTVDKIETIPEFFIKTWYNNTIVLLNSDTWAVIAFLAFFITALGITLFFVMKSSQIKKLVFPIASLFLIVFTVTLIFSVKTKGFIEHSTYGIVVEQTVTVKSSPDMESVDVFIIHEGTKVNVLRNLAGWYEVKIADGKQGWLTETDIEKI